MPTWPTWWDWDLELSAHLFKRMADRDFNEIAIRRMLSVATGFRLDVVPDRWISRPDTGDRPGRSLWNSTRPLTF